MSTKLGDEFGQAHGEEYARVVVKWAKRLKGVEKVSDEDRKKWGVDLRKALGPQIMGVIEAEIAPGWKKAGELPTDETLQRFYQIAAKIALEKEMGDLLLRLRDMAQRPEPEGESPEDALKALTSAGFLVTQAVKRSAQTVAQIFDMVSDRFNGLMERFFTRKGSLTGRRRWQTASLKSRHRRLDGQIKTEGDLFIFKGDSVYGPRPPGGSPENWSNCSCLLQRERTDGNWVTVT